MSFTKSDEPIDAVVTWVDGEDPVHEKKLESYLGRRAKKRPKAAAKTRYADRGELEYCLASLIRFAPWLRRIYIVTDEQTPGFLETLPSDVAQSVSVVDHKIIFQDFHNNLPTFNSLSIETMLWRIPGLANNFIYFNDDCFLIKAVEPGNFFSDDGVVLRGTFRSPVRRRPMRKLARWFGIGRPTRRTLQSEAAALAGLDDQYLDVDHIPHPMRVSTFRDFFARHPEQLGRNSSFPLRDVRQFWPIALANHLELKHHSAQISSVPKSLYLSVSAGTCDRESLIDVEGDPDCKFLCAQSLDKVSDEFLGVWKAWMDKTVGRLTRAPN
ncbi:MAG: stealth family protein [Marinobacter sp.]|uniref:stealth family protein n=1 Tax=Marinobacter sp. TaxID=50741 RepID=UPI00329A7E43